MKSAETGSYEIDDGDQIADFLSIKSGCHLHDTEQAPSEVFTACTSLTDSYNNTLSSPEIDCVELACLYYLAGYVLSRVKKNDSTCSECMNSVCLNDVNDFDPAITRLHTLKEYREGCLAKCNQAVFDLLVVGEMIFRKQQAGFLTSAGNIKEFLIGEIERDSPQIVLPNCHAIKRKIISRFVGARLQFFAKKLRMIRKECTVKSSKHEMSSKSMQMRKSVSKLK